MNAAGEAIAEAAQELIGATFRLHGRRPNTGLDCVGVVAASLVKAGVEPILPTGYSLRNASPEEFIPFAAASGLSPVEGPIRAGDILLVQTGPAQLHLMIALGSDAFVHADAGLRRVTRIRALMDWDVLKHWRYQN